jgi:diguanylate cyclase (GGDEF)-like protein
VFRVGGDEFVFIIEEYPDFSALITVLEKIKHSVDEPIFFNGKQMPLGISIGVACITKGISCSAHELLSFADEAMYKAKKQGVDYVISNNDDFYHKNKPV